MVCGTSEQEVESAIAARELGPAGSTSGLAGGLYVGDSKFVKRFLRR